MTETERLAAYEAMHRAVRRDYDEACRKMAELKAQGKEKTVTFRTYFADKLKYQELLSFYQAYGLEEDGESRGRA